MSLIVPLKTYSSEVDSLELGKHRLFFKNPYPSNDIDEKVHEFGYEIYVPFSNYVVTLVSSQYDKKLDNWIVIINIESKTDVSEYQEAGLPITAITVGLAAVAAIGVTALIFVKGEKILIIPSLAIILTVGFLFWKDIKGFLNA